MALITCCPSYAVCFVATDRPIVPVYQQAPPPRFDGQPKYPYYPVTVAATAQIDKLLESRSSVQVAYWQWANHGPRQSDGGYKGNITPGSYGVQIRFSSNASANACTMAQTSALFGIGASRALPEAGGLRFTTASQRADTRDVCIMPNGTLPTPAAVVLDYEVQDDRSGEETKDFLIAWAKLVRRHGHEAILYSNALDAPSQRRTHLPSVAAEVAKQFDKVHILLWSANSQGDIARSFSAQAKMYDAPPAKILVAFELAGTTQNDAETVHGILSSGRASGINFWRNHAKQGGECDSEVNRKIACIALGKCGN